MALVSDGARVSYLCALFTGAYHRTDILLPGNVNIPVSCESVLHNPSTLYAVHEFSKQQTAVLLLDSCFLCTQVSTLRDKVSTLSRDLATAQGEYCVRGHQSVSDASRKGESAAVEPVVDASMAQELHTLRRELGEAQAALDAQMPMVWFFFPLCSWFTSWSQVGVIQQGYHGFRDTIEEHSASCSTEYEAFFLMSATLYAGRTASS